MQDFSNIIFFVKNYVVSNELFMILVLLVAIYLSVRLVFPQFRLIVSTFRALKDTGDKDHGISSFSAFMTALGSRIGVGNVAGIATAICLGGPGSIFWVWIFGIFGSAVAIVEGILGQAFKVKMDGEYFGGPAYYINQGIKNGFVSKYISKAYAVIAVLAFGIMMNGIQCNTVVASIVNGFHTDKTVTIIVTAIVVAIIIWGGIKRISGFESVLTPIKCIVYLFFAAVVIVYYNEYLGLVFKTIFESALGLNAVFGGMLGSAISMGVRRGIFSTDVCYGPGGIFSAAARADHPVKQGLLQGLSVLLSTLLICTATALVILLSGSFDVVDFTGNVVYTAYDFSGQTPGVEWVQHALDGVPVFNGWASQVLAIVISIFACGTIIGYYYCLESNLRFLIGTPNKIVINVSKLVFLAALVTSSALESSFVWDLTDIGSGLLAWINLLSIIVLVPFAIKILKSFSGALRQGKTPKFDPADFGIEDKTGAWDRKNFDK